MDEHTKELSNTFDAEKEVGLTHFHFYDNALIEQVAYSITLEVGGECTKDTPLVDDSIEGLPGLLKSASENESKLNDLI